MHIFTLYPQCMEKFNLDTLAHSIINPLILRTVQCSKGNDVVKLCVTQNSSSKYNIIIIIITVSSCSSVYMAMVTVATQQK